MPDADCAFERLLLAPFALMRANDCVYGEALKPVAGSLSHHASDEVCTDGYETSGKATWSSKVHELPLTSAFDMIAGKEMDPDNGAAAAALVSGTLPFPSTAAPGAVSAILGDEAATAAAAIARSSVATAAATDCAAVALSEKTPCARHHACWRMPSCSGRATGSGSSMARSRSAAAGDTCAGMRKRPDCTRCAKSSKSDARTRPEEALPLPPPLTPPRLSRLPRTSRLMLRLVLVLLELLPLRMLELELTSR